MEQGYCARAGQPGREGVSQVVGSSPTAPTNSFNVLAEILNSTLFAGGSKVDTDLDINDQLT